MAKKCINLDATRKYICKEDKENSTEFIIGMLPARVRAKILDETITFESSSDNPNDNAKAIIHSEDRRILGFKFGVKGWKNLLGPNDENMPYQSKSDFMGGLLVQAIPDDLINIIDPEVLSEVGEEVLKKNELTEKEAKNSDSQSGAGSKV